jgi:hypothetical protein
LRLALKADLQVASVFSRKSGHQTWLEHLLAADPQPVLPISEQN